jgi:hypothetical protein
MQILSPTSGYSCLRVMVIQIDVHPARGKPDIHDTYAFCASPHTPHILFLWEVHVHGNLSLAINSIGRTLLLLRKRAPDTIPSMPANRSIGPPPSSSPKTIIEAVIKAKHMLTTCYIGLLGSQHQHGSVRSILVHGVNPSVLNRHRRGLQPWRCRLTTSHSPMFPIDDPPLSS